MFQQASKVKTDLLPPNCSGPGPIMTTSLSDKPSEGAKKPPALLILGVAAFLIPTGLALLISSKPINFFAILAGPWAARLNGHTCGVVDFSPEVAYGLAGLGVVVVLMANRFRSRSALIPLLLWWTAWTFAALLSLINTTV